MHIGPHRTPFSPHVNKTSPPHFLNRLCQCVHENPACRIRLTGSTSKPGFKLSNASTYSTQLCSNAGTPKALGHRCERTFSLRCNQLKGDPHADTLQASPPARFGNEPAALLCFCSSLWTGSAIPCLPDQAKDTPLALLGAIRLQFVPASYLGGKSDNSHRLYMEPQG